MMHAYEPRLSCELSTGAYADDIALVLHRLWKEAGIMANLFSKLETIVRLCLKPKKCVLIPLWVGTVGASFSALLKEEELRWAGFEIDSKGKYLGVWLGPGASDLSWEKR